MNKLKANSLRKIIFIIVIIIANSGFCQKNIPNTQLKSNSGELIDLREFSNDKTVVLLFWATWCVPCINELNTINEVYSEWQEETNLVILAISIDDYRTVSRVMPLVRGYNWDYEILFDTNQELKRSLNILNIPYQIAIHDGSIFYRHTGYIHGQEKILINAVREHLRNN